MRKINAKTLLDTFTALGTVAVLCMSVGNADANVLSVGNSLTVPLENLPVTFSPDNYRIRYEPTQSIANGTVVVNLSGGTFGSDYHSFDSHYVGLYGWKYGEITHEVCQGEVAGSSVTLTNCSLNSGSFYVFAHVSSLGVNPFPPFLSFNMTNSPLVISVNSIAGSGSATLFTAAPELRFKVSHNSSAGITISVSDAYNKDLWYQSILFGGYGLNYGGIATHSTLNFILSNLPSSVTRVTCHYCIRNNVTPGNNSATVSYDYDGGNDTFHFIFNNGHMQTKHIKPIHVIAVSHINVLWHVADAYRSYTWFIIPDTAPIHTSTSTSTPMTTSVPINQTPNSNKMQTTQNPQGNVNNNQNTNSAVNQVYNMINSVLPSILPRILK